MRFENQNIFFTSDFHIGHKNVIRFDGRPFETVLEMHNTIIENWNSVVGEEDVVFYLGDLSFTNEESTKWFISQLNGKIYYILGNHDKFRDISRLGRFEKIFEYGTEIFVKDEDVQRGYQQIILSHYAIINWNRAHHGSWHLHGHSHQSLAKNPNFDWYYQRKVIDVGCNGWDYTPISYTQLKDVMSKKVTSPVDHHE